MTETHASSISLANRPLDFGRVCGREPENATLNPQNVTQSFRIGPADQVVSFSPTFSRPQKKVVQHRA